MNQKKKVQIPAIIQSNPATAHRFSMSTSSIKYTQFSSNNNVNNSSYGVVAENLIMNSSNVSLVPSTSDARSNFTNHYKPSSTSQYPQIIPTLAPKLELWEESSSNENFTDEAELSSSQTHELFLSSVENINFLSSFEENLAISPTEHVYLTPIVHITTTLSASFTPENAQLSISGERDTTDTTNSPVLPDYADTVVSSSHWKSVEVTLMEETAVLPLSVIDISTLSSSTNEEVDSTSDSLFNRSPSSSVFNKESRKPKHREEKTDSVKKEYREKPKKKPKVKKKITKDSGNGHNYKQNISNQPGFLEAKHSSKEAEDDHDKSITPESTNKTNETIHILSLPTVEVPVHLMEKGCFLDRMYIPPQANVYKDRNNCTKCLCKNGDLQCSSYHCPPPHCEVPVHGECCDFCPGDCLEGRDVFLPGEVFSHPLDPCRECHCESGHTVCDNIECQPLTCPVERQVHPKKECCPACPPEEPLGCISQGQHFYPGQLWVRQEGGCHACLCKEGQVQCNPVVCVVDCQHPQYNLGECCPKCEGCQHYNKQYHNEEIFPHPSDSCSQCQCLHGNITCYHKPCSTECTHPYQTPGHCCPRCYDCNFVGHRLRNGSSVAVSTNDTCQVCSCKLGNVTCKPGPCAASCEVEGHILPSGSEFNIAHDACTLCRCTDGLISCQAVECPSTCSHGVLLSNQCCLDCSKCDYQGQLYSEMEVFRPDNTPCKSCLCVKGNVMCQDTCTSIVPVQ